MSIMPGLERELVQAAQRVKSVAAPRQRRGLIRTRRRLFATFAVMLVTVGGATAAVTLSTESTPPVRLGGLTLCPASYQYLAYSGLRLVYPPNYPGRLPDRNHASSCYLSLQAARDAGYSLAPTPRGDTRVGPIYLAPASTTVRTACQTAQRLTTARILCPTVMPAPAPAPSDTPDCPTHACQAGSLLSISTEFLTPESYTGSGPGVGEAAVWEGSMEQLRAYPYLVGCGFSHRRLVSHTTFHGHRADWYSCQVAIFGDIASSVLQWKVGHETYGILADGPTSLRKHLIRYIADHMTPEP